MLQRVGKANTTLSSAVNREKTCESGTLPSELSTFKLCLEVTYPAGGRRAAKSMIHGTWTQSSQSHSVANPTQPESSSQGQNNSPAKEPLSPQWSSHNGRCSLPQRTEPLTTIPFTTSAPFCLNFSEGPCQTLSLFVTTSPGFLSPRHCVRVSLGYLSYDCSLVLGPQSSSVSNNSPPLKIAPVYSIMRYGKWQNVFFYPI
jgi:hypothetical protein